ncbi:MAG: SSS family solute:Na+ symporter [Phycisphaerales bacterium]|jgi:SSS family solute:Na+ symporter
MGTVPAIASFGRTDWAVLAVYFLILVGSGIWFSRKKQQNTEDYFLGGRSMPVWAVAVSIVATSMSAVSFIGAPGAAYSGDLTYLATNIGMILAAVVIAFGFIPVFYRSGSQTIYGVLETRYGPAAKLAASIAFMLGRVLASGARIYIGAIPASMLLFGVEHGLEPTNLLIAISIMTAVGIGYTLIGGIASVIWSDVLQMGILLGACLVAVILILLRLEAPIGEVFSALQVGVPATTDPETGEVLVEAASKLTLFDLRLDPSLPYSVLACFIGFTLLGIGSYGTDQDLAQRMLTCKDAKAGARSVIAGILLGIPSVALFSVVGLLLWAFYQRPEMFGAGGPTQAPSDDRQVFLEFILTQMPPGLTGLMMAGLFAAGLSSLNSAINAMSSTFIADIYRPLRPGRDEHHYLNMGRLGVLGWGLVLGGFACVCVYWQRQHGEDVDGGDLLLFALGVMTFAYAGLIAVFFSALFTKRGSSASVIAALVTGFVVVLLLQPMFWENFIDLESLAANALGNERANPLAWLLALSFTWKLTIGVGLSFAVCQIGNKPKEPGESQALDADTAAPNAAPNAAK